MTSRPCSRPSRRGGGTLFRRLSRKQSRPAGICRAYSRPRDGGVSPPWFVVLALAMTVAGIVPANGAQECLGSVRAVWAAHSGSHATWESRGGHTCYFAGYGRHHQVAVALRLPPPPPLPRARPKGQKIPVTPRELPHLPPPNGPWLDVDMAASFAERFNAAYAPLPTGWGWR